MIIFNNFSNKTKAKQELLLELATRPNSFRFLVPKRAFETKGMYYKFMAVHWTKKVLSVEGTTNIYTKGQIQDYGYPWERAEVSFQQLMDNWDVHKVIERDSDIFRLSKFWKYLQDTNNQILTN